MGKCKNCSNWKKWDGYTQGSNSFGGCEIVNDRQFIYPEIEDCMDVCNKTNDFYNNTNGEFGCIKFKQKKII